MGAPYITKRQQVVLKLETVEGTAATTSASNVVAPVYDVEWKPTFTMAERDVQQSSFSRLRQVAGERSATISFATELKGSGTLGTRPTHLDSALRACAMTCTSAAGVSITYVPSSTQSAISCTVEIREGDQGAIAKIYKISGARGTFSIDSVKGDVTLVRFTFSGKYNEPTDGAFLTAASTGAVPVAFLSAQFAFHGVSVKIQNASIDLGQTVSMRNDANQSGGNYSAIITGRAVKGSMDPEQDATSVINYFSKLTANTEGVFRYVLSGGSGNVTLVSASKVQLLNVSPGDREGIRIETCDLAFNQVATAGNDEFTIKFT